MSDPADSHNPSLRPPAAEPGRPRPPALPTIDVFEKGAKKDGVPQTMNRRLFMQLLVFRVSQEATLDTVNEALDAALTGSGVGGVIYDDVNDPRGLGVLTYSEDPSEFVDQAAAGARHAYALGAHPPRPR